ncbi:MAG TPA: putative quinol monooxygenase [Acidimicrobiales bacterium]
MIIIAGTLTFDPEKAEVLAEGFDKVQKATLAEPGCLAYDYWLSRTTPGVVLMFEKWESEEDLAAHMKGENMAAVGALMGQIGITSADVKKYSGATEGPLF